jgi:outer membrane protein insertion porin family
VGGLLGAEEDFYKVGAMLENFHPIYEDTLERKHVFYHRFSLDVGETFGSSDVLFPSERFFMGGGNLRGFKQRQAGPTQFGQPLGGEARFLSTLEYQYPLVSTRMQGTTRETEIVRGVIFADFGLLGLDISDSSFHEPRLSVGFGVRILVPVLQIPIHLDLGWPILSEETDDEQQVFFTLSRF